MVVGEFTQETDLLIIGGGPAGYAAAFRAAELGVQTTIVDSRDALGGVCLHEGCVPSKTLLAMAEIIRAAASAKSFGIAFAKAKIDGAKIGKWLDKTVDKLARGLDSRAKQLKIERIGGVARFEDSKHVAISGGAVPRIKFRRALIATGAKPIPSAQLPFDGERIIRPEHAVRPERIPESLAVIGNGYTAVEIASIHSALGAKAAIISEEKTLLPETDDDLVNVLRKSLEGQGVEFRLGADVDESLLAEFDQAVIALGVSANVDELGLDATNVARDRAGFISVDQQMRTSDQRIFAAGDVTGHPCLANRALAQGRIAAEVIAGREASAFDARAIPHAIFTDPQIAWVGVTEREAKAQALEHAVARMPWGFSGRAVGMDRAEGLTKIILDPETKLVLGAGIIGASACEMIGEGALAIEMGAELDDLALTLHPHPTMSELLADAARSAIIE